MAVEPSLQVQRELNYAIVDEVDNILIDEARTPLIISGPAQEPVRMYHDMAKLARRLRDERDYTMIDERSQAISLTEEGISRIEGWIKVENLYAPRKRPPRAVRGKRPQGPRALQARQGICGQGRSGNHRGRVHRPSPARPPLGQRPSPGHRSQGGHPRSAGERDLRYHHPSELLPHCTTSSRA